MGRQSRPTFHRVAPDRFVVSVTPTDKLGNIAAPGNAAEPGVILLSEAVRGRHLNPYTGEQQVEIHLRGQGFRPAKDGQAIEGGSATLETITGEILNIEPGKNLLLEVQAGQATLPVFLPRIVGDSRSRKAYWAGTQEAMEVPLADREVFSDEEARGRGYEL